MINEGLGDGSGRPRGASGGPFHFTSHLANTYPTSLPRYDPITHLPQISESTILGYSKYLSEDIGYRTVGTKEHALGDQWMVEQVERLKEECESVVRQSGGARGLECEIWRQEGSGSHRCVSSSCFPSILLGIDDSDIASALT